MSKQKGDIAEEKAISFLEDLDYKIIEQNFYAKKLGEIDIIATSIIGIKNEITKVVNTAKKENLILLIIEYISKPINGK